jgi:DNA-directed RNA polymerase alpha subunit
MTQAWDFVDADILWHRYRAANLHILNLRIQEQQFSSRVLISLRQYTDDHRSFRSINTVADLIELTPLQLLRQPNLGRKSVDEIRAFLAEHNLTLKDDPTGLRLRSTKSAPELHMIHKTR